MSLIKLLEQNRKQIHAIAKEHGARHIQIFGSVARGDDRPNSDVDFLVEMEAGRDLFDLSALKMDLESLLGREVDVVTKKSIYKPLEEQIMNEAKDL